jgi:hypothetical protein
MGWISRGQLQVTTHQNDDTSLLISKLRGGAEDADVSLHGTVHAESLYLPGLLETAIHRTNKVREMNEDHEHDWSYWKIIKRFINV